MSVQLEIASQLLRNPKGSSEAALEQLQEMKEFVRNGLSEARSSIWELRSEGGAKDILPSRIAVAAKHRTQTDGPPVSFQVHGTYRPLVREIEDQILRIAQEAVSNAVRHANAGRIEITLTYDVKNIAICIRDDGCGFRDSQNSFASGGHFGLQGMRERASSIGALLHVDGHEGKGTEVLLTLAVEQEIGKDA
jgi:signal transduction histidine kinase